MHQSYILTVLGSNPSRPTVDHNHEKWYNFIMENVFDQDAIVAAVVEEIVQKVTSDEVVEILTEEDYATADESDIDWATL